MLAQNIKQGKRDFNSLKTKQFVLLPLIVNNQTQFNGSHVVQIKSRFYGKLNLSLPHNLQGRRGWFISFNLMLPRKFQFS